MFATPNQVSILSVSKLNRFAKRVLESEIGLVWVTGEVSNFVAASSGHWYFTLKDSQAQVKTAMFRGANQRAGFLPKAGDKVVVKANISLYEPRGDYQLIAQHIEPEGVGQLKLAFEALKAKLQSEGLFEQGRKRPVPASVTRLGLVTSPTGAAVHDILHVLARRNPAIEVIIYPSMVQGEQAAGSIVKQIEVANARNEVDVLIVGRGGGSLEDLWPFNEEAVARAIFASDLPIVSAVGHEVDVTIADFVADARAPTPSAAAETISQDAQVLKRSVEQLRQRMTLAMNQRYRGLAQSVDIVMARLAGLSPANNINKQQTMLNGLQKRLANSHPQTAILRQQTALTDLLANLKRAMKVSMHESEQRAKHAQVYLSKQNPTAMLEEQQVRLKQLKQTMIKQQTNLIEKRSNALAAQANLLQSVSPLATLSRGYSISYHEQKIVRSIEQVSAKDTIVTKLTDGEILSHVIEVKGDDKA
ncbi:exodeoxyribonuclease VII large subunit [Glaciecola sp. XM2]|uniref:exodeoxyribonuclease VII large subunit n=1 Tax=Glaciecola sp. XM2 TaxID=1914931 RepID=UPI001BDF4D0F|nr:exodeoxyribonuclease VII large subunit [Glaciecola sp. XM2]MBT1452366.1 exodeoxyribonuclease VII large subunit [Glaciecola sp. XM2]